MNGHEHVVCMLLLIVSISCWDVGSSFSVVAPWIKRQSVTSRRTVESSSRCTSLCPLFVSNPATLSEGGNEKELLEYIQQQDEEEKVPKTANDFMTRLEELAKVKSSSSNPEETINTAESLLESMKNAYSLTKDVDLFPNRTVYNLLLEIHSKNLLPDYQANGAETLLKRMEDSSDDDIPSPDLHSYTHVMESWARRKNVQKVEETLDRLVERFQTTKDEALRPNLFAYHKLFNVLLMCRQPERAEELLKTLLKRAGEQQQQDSDDDDKSKIIMPNSNTFCLVIKAYADLGTPEALEKISYLIYQQEKLVRVTGDERLRPNIFSYNELIRAIQTAVPDHKARAQQAESVLYQTMEAYKQDHDNLRPNAATIKNVIYAYKGNKNSKVPYMIDKLLQIQENVVRHPTLGPYNAALKVISFTKNIEKEQMADRILKQIKNKGLEPNLQTYNAVLSCCGNCVKSPSKNLKDSFRIAVGTLSELRNHDTLEPDATSYGFFLRSCNSMLTDEKKKDLVLETTFQHCCQEGKVGKFVLKELMEAASPELLKQLLGTDPEGTTKGIKIPRKWSRNVTDPKQLLRP